MKYILVLSLFLTGCGFHFEVNTDRNPETYIDIYYTNFGSMTNYYCKTLFYEVNAPSLKDCYLNGKKTDTIIYNVTNYRKIKEKVSKYE